MNNLDEQKDIIETQVELEQVPKKKERKKMNRTLKYFLNIVIILLITTLYAWLTLKDSHEEVLAALTSPNADYRFIALIIGFILLYFAVDGLILFIFARLYTTTYKLHRGIANAFIGQFYSNITPGASGGQFAQAVTFKKQGVDVSTGASILVMHYILYQIVLMIFGFVSIVFNFNTFMRGAPIVILDVEIPVWILTGLGYLLNAIVIVGLFLLAYSKKIHSWTINTGVNIGAKLKLIRNPEEKRKKLMLSTENFRIELRRLQSNIPASLLIMFLFVVRFFLLYSIPYFVIVMLDPSFTTQPIYLQTVVSNSFLQMVTGLFPLPGAAGFTEYFFERLFSTNFRWV
ncbi:MAG: lysylphosphatidylglycerol synthase transmembrane domain-containing protein [Bacilli bacterium]